MAKQADEFAVTLNVTVRRGYQGFWNIIRAVNRSGRPWSARDVHALTSGGTKIAQVSDYLRRLTRGGFLVEIASAPRVSTLYRLKVDQPEAPGLHYDGKPVRETGLGRAQMWRSMKMLATFDVRSLARHATTDEATVTVPAATRYVTHLARAGYLVQVAPPRRGRRSRFAVYRLLPAMNTGPLAPQVQDLTWVWDPNREKVMGPEAEGAK